MFSQTSPHIMSYIGAPNIEDDIAYYFSALAEFMCQGDVSQWQAASDRVGQPVALEVRTELGKAAIAIDSTES